MWTKSYQDNNHRIGQQTYLLIGYSDAPEGGMTETDYDEFPTQEAAKAHAEALAPNNPAVWSWGVHHVTWVEEYCHDEDGVTVDASREHDESESRYAENIDGKLEWEDYE